jgi:4'-phosphopantetheinyl transferase EntD
VKTLLPAEPSTRRGNPRSAPPAVTAPCSRRAGRDVVIGSPHAALRRALKKLAGSNVSVAVATDEMYQAPLFPEEACAMVSASSRRRAEYAAGRSAARVALSELGYAPAPIPTSTDRLPLWPRGVVGSISHTDGACCAVAADDRNVRSLGLDLERSQSLPPKVIGSILDGCEQHSLRSMPLPQGFFWPILGFCAKEAFYKCYYPISKQYLDFLDVRLMLAMHGQHRGSFRASLVVGHGDHEIAGQIQGRWAISGSLAMAVAVLGR